MQNVLGSLGRAGGGFRQDVLAEPEEQDLRVTVGLADAIPKEAKNAVRDFLKGYAEESGWRVKDLSLKKTYLRFKLTKAS